MTPHARVGDLKRGSEVVPAARDRAQAAKDPGAAARCEAGPRGPLSPALRRLRGTSRAPSSYTRRPRKPSAASVPPTPAPAQPRGARRPGSATGSAEVSTAEAPGRRPAATGPASDRNGLGAGSAAAGGPGPPYLRRRARRACRGRAGRSALRPPAPWCPRRPRRHRGDATPHCPAPLGPTPLRRGRFRQRHKAHGGQLGPAAQLRMRVATLQHGSPPSCAAPLSGAPNKSRGKAARVRGSPAAAAMLFFLKGPRAPRLPRPVPPAKLQPPAPWAGPRLLAALSSGEAFVFSQLFSERCRP